jgi:hypothetical protein
MKIIITIETYEWTEENTKNFENWLSQEKINISDNTYVVSIEKQD